MAASPRRIPPFGTAVYRLVVVSAGMFFDFPIALNRGLIIMDELRVMKQNTPHIKTQLHHLFLFILHLNTYSTV
jgi:hypothetical protein